MRQKLSLLLVLLCAACEGPEAPPDEFGDAVGKAPVDYSTNTGLLSINDASGCPIHAGEEGEVIEVVNRVRKMHGFSCAEPQFTLTGAAQSHAAYLAKYEGTSCDVGAHRETDAQPCWDLFTGVTAADRAANHGFWGAFEYEVIAYSGDGTTDARLWLDTVYHRLPFHDVSANKVGYARPTQPGIVDYPWGVAVFGNTSGTQGSMGLSRYPVQSQDFVPRSWNGLENPEPQPPPGGWPSGYPISMVNPGFSVSTHDISVLRNLSTWESVPHVFLSNANDTFLHQGEYFMYTYTPMEYRTWYKAKLCGTKAGINICYEWTFLTGF